jgi:hypothetical protein
MGKKKSLFYYVYYVPLLVLIMVFQKNGYAQEMLGVGLGNYSGVMSTLYNPAMLTNNKAFLDINIVSADVFFRQDMYYIPKGDYSVYKAMHLVEPPKYGEDSINAKNYTDTETKFFHTSIRVAGPSASFQWGDHGFALTTGTRFFTSAYNIPWEMPTLGYIGITNDSLHNINFIDYNIDMSSSAWTEVGFSYAYNIYKYFDTQITLGITVRKLWGYAGLTMSVDNIDYIIVNDTTVNIRNANAGLGFSLPLDYNSNDINHNPFFKGSGISADLGVVYVKKKRGYKRWDRYSLCSQPYEDYFYRIGVSILDIGSLRFKNNAQWHTYDNVTSYWDNIDTINFSNINGVMHSLSRVFYGDPTSSLKSTSFSMGLPTALSVQMDFHTAKNLYIGGFWIHPLQLFKNSMRRAAQVAVVPRYETKYFEVNVPVSIYDYKYPRIGLSARFWFFTIGTERLGTWLGLADLNGLDIYTSIKINIGEKGVCRSRRYNACQNGEYGYSAKQRKLFRKHRR